MTMRSFWKSWSIAQLTMFVVLVPLLGTSVILSYYHITGRLQEMSERLQLEGELNADHISHDSVGYMLSGDKQALQFIIDRVVKQSDVGYIEIIDKHKRVVVSAGISGANKNAVDSLEIIKAITYKNNPVDKVNHGVEAQEVVVGWVRLNMSLQAFEEKKYGILFNSLIILLAGLSISVLIVFLISKSLFTPLKILHTAVERISAGSFNTKLSMAQDGECHAVGKKTAKRKDR